MTKRKPFHRRERPKLRGRVRGGDRCTGWKRLGKKQEPLPNPDKVDATRYLENQQALSKALAKTLKEYGSRDISR